MVSFSNINIKAGKTLYKASPWEDQTFFWIDFNPNLTTEHSWGASSSVYVTEELTIDCLWLTNWHEVLVWLYKYENLEATNQTNSISIRWQKLVSWIRTTIFTFNWWSVTVTPWWWWYTYAYIWIDYDEIWTAWSYRIQWLQNWNVLITSSTYSITNVSPRSTVRTSWPIWIDEWNIHYIDASYTSSSWFEHVIAYDPSYTATYIWTDKAWFMWIDDNWNNRRIYYIDENWYKRRTHLADDWKSPTYVWTDKAWFMWISNWQSEYEWYAYLCYIWADWYKYRIMNGPV